MEVFRHSELPRRSTESIWHSAWAILPLLMVLASAHAASNPPLNVNISTEAAPPGATVQIKLSLDKPAAVASGELAIDLDPGVFGPVSAIATFSAAGDSCGFADISGSHVDVHFQSVSATLGSAAGTPLVVITVPTFATAKPGTQVPVNADPSGSQWGSTGQPYEVTVTPGTVTVGGSLSVSDVSPVSNLAAGAVVRIRGTGFTSATTVNIAAVSVASVQLAGPQEIDVTLAGPADLGGKRITVSNPGGPPVDFFAAPAISTPFATPGSTASDGLDGAIPLFPAASYPAGLSNVLIQGFTLGRVALANPNAAPVDALVQAVDQPDAIRRQTTITIPPGGAYNSRSGLAGSER